jgi:subtilase family serine protease
MVRAVLMSRSAGVALALLASVAVSAPATADAKPSPRVTFYFGLKRPEASARKAFWAVSQPSSSQYRHFLTLRQVASRYGASPRSGRSSEPGAGTGWR